MNNLLCTLKSIKEFIYLNIQKAYIIILTVNEKEVTNSIALLNSQYPTYLIIF